MRRGRIFIYLAFILILGLAAAFLVWQRFLLPQEEGVGPEVEPTPVITTVNVVVLAQRVSRGTPVSAEVLGLIPVQQELFYDGMFTNISEVEGQLAKFDLEAGIPLTRGMLVESAEQLSGTGSIAALSIPRGMVAVSVPISRLSSVSYAPQAGDHVNIITTLMFVDLDTDFQTSLPNLNISVTPPTAGPEVETPSLVATTGGGGGLIGRPSVDPVLGQTFYQVPGEETQRPRMVSQNLLQDIVVLQVGNFPLVVDKPVHTDAPEAQLTETDQAAEETPQEVQPPDLITLIVTPQDAITLNYMLYSGAQLTLALRSAEDDTRVQTEAVTLQFLLEQYNIPIPVKLPNGLQPRVDFLVPPVLQNDLPQVQSP
ncbi:MAG TPA: RcpC/CpaB family pilus assembly protein [Anaerolineales bacterium]|nr:RcpC/CpaB family pilus assembly protein [Anaerolineales bacterium]